MRSSPSINLIAELIRDGRIKSTERVEDSVTYHDSCCLGRHNGIYDSPRDALSAGAQARKPASRMVPRLGVLRLGEGSSVRGIPMGRCFLAAHHESRHPQASTSSMELATIAR